MRALLSSVTVYFILYHSVDIYCDTVLCSEEFLRNSLQRSETPIFIKMIDATLYTVWQKYLTLDKSTSSHTIYCHFAQ